MLVLQPKRPAGMRPAVVPMALLALTLATASAQQDPLMELNSSLRQATDGSVSFTFEERTRWEEKYGVNFGKSVNQQDMLSRLRIGARFEPTAWLKIYGMGQDARTPFYGVPAPNSMRDTLDLQEAYAELFGNRKNGFGASFGRKMLDYGETRLIGSPQWSNVSRTYDFASASYRTAKARFEALAVSPVKVISDAFNKPEPGERIWGAYNVFSGIWRGASIDAYALRHSQNRIGGWTGAGTLGSNSFGGRFYGPLPLNFAYSLEGIGQTGHMGPLSQRAYAWFAGLSGKATAAKRTVNFSIEYKGASGTRAGSSGSSTFDQLSPANHDKFGHEDLFGWRNLKTVKSLETLNVTKSLAVNAMYTNHWLFSASDALYNSQGASIATSKNGAAGTHVGQEMDLFLTCKKGLHVFGAGFGHFFKGEFIENTAYHVNPRYFYIFQQYLLK